MHLQHSLQTGVALSRGRVVLFKHNDLQDLEKKLVEIEAEDVKKKRSPYRKFVMVEGVYFNTGQLCDLPKLLALKHKHKFRIILDDSVGFGTMGKCGRGTLEHFGLSTTDVDIYMGSLGSSLGSVGGFCAGTRLVIFHQRLNANGYVFSASSPPFLMAGATASLNLLQKDGTKLLETLREKVSALRKMLAKISHFSVEGFEAAPVIHLRLSKQVPAENCRLLLEEVVSEALKEGVFLTVAKYVPTDVNAPPPSIRLTVSVNHTEQHLLKAANVIEKVANKILS